MNATDLRRTSVPRYGLLRKDFRREKDSGVGEATDGVG